MKVLHVISDLNPRSGGPTNVVRALSKYQASANIDVTVCTTNWGYNKNIGDFDKAEKIVSYKYFQAWPPLLVSPIMARWFFKNQKKFDIIHIHGLYRFPVSSAAWCARKLKIPYVISPHGSLDPFLYRQSRYSVELKRAYEKCLDIPNLNFASAIHYTTQEEKKRASYLRLKAKPIIIPNGIDWEIFRNLPLKGNFRNRIGLDAEMPLVLFLGRINFKKGLDILIPAFRIISSKFPNARLAIVGPDNEKYSINVRRWCVENDIQDKVFFVDYLRPANVKEAYIDADVFVLPSYTENFGLTVVEAMACGTPVVVSDQVNIWREVKTAKAGLVVPLDPLATAEAVCQILNNPQEAKKIGCCGRFIAEKLYSWPLVVRQLTDKYRELTE